MAFRIKCPNCKEPINLENAGSSTIVCSKCKCAYLINIIKNGERYEMESLRLLFNPRNVRKWDIAKDKWKHLPTKIKVAIPVAFVFMLAVLIGCDVYTRPSAIETTKAYADMENVWKEFREKNPYNFQTVGIKRYDDNSYTMILSEPSEKVSVEDLQQFFKKYNCKLDTFKHEMGYDGWLKDAVVCFNDIKESRLPKLTSNLFKLLYGTDYKSELLDLDTIPEHTAFSIQELNYQISAEELHSWFVDNKEPMICVSDTTKETYLEDALKDFTSESTLYYSKEPGFVIWVINRSSTSFLNTEDFRIKARMFSLDSDLILGAIANNWRVAIIARERTIPIYELPPMRQETLLMLASTDKTELSQSYERNNLFAGKLLGGKDYAPILLSDELWHTEYGNILNITDQMLKSWSENGNIEYHAFAYPKPFDWAFDDGVLNDLGVYQLTYNWNTAGAGYIIDEEDGFKVYAINRTGSLPVSYIPGKTNKISENNPIYRAEEKAYNFYSGLSSPELVKVVQYTSMYQLFTNLNIHVQNDNSNYSNTVTTEKLDIEVESILKSVLNFGPEQKQKISDYFRDNLQRDDNTIRKELAIIFDQENNKYKEYWAIISKNSYQVDKNSFIESNLKDVRNRENTSIEEFVSKIDTIRSVLRELDSTMGGKSSFFRTVGHYVINPRDIDFSGLSSAENLNEEYFCQYIANNILAYSEELKLYNSILKLSTLERTKQLYLDENKNKSLFWQKCPTIVESWGVKDSAFATGGHNLSSSITPIKINNKLTSGKYNVIEENGHKIIEIAALDKGRVTPTFLRTVERTLNEGTYTYNRKPTEVIRARTVVISPSTKRSARGFNRTDHLTIGREGKVYSLNGKKSGTVDDLIKEATEMIDNGKTHTSVTLEFKSICEDECMTIVERLREVRLKKSKTFSKIPCRALDVTNIVTEDIGNGNVRVKMAVKAEEVKKIILEEENIQEASMGGGSTKKSFWNRVKEIFIVFEVPKSMANDFVKFLQQYVREHSNSIFRRFEIRQGAKEKGINIQNEIDGLKVAELFKGRNYAKFLEEKEVA